MGSQASHVSQTFLTCCLCAPSQQEILTPSSFVLNNGGYTVERLIHGKEAFYNEVAILDYALLAKTFGPAFESKYHGPIKTCGDLSGLLRDPDFGNAGCLEVSKLSSVFECLANNGYSW